MNDPEKKATPKAGSAENAQDYYDCAPEPETVSEEGRAYSDKLFEGIFKPKPEK